MKQKGLSFFGGIMLVLVTVVLLNISGAMIPREDTMQRRLAANLIFLGIPLLTLKFMGAPKSALFGKVFLPRHLFSSMLIIAFLFGLTLCLSSIFNLIWPAEPMSLALLYGESIPMRILFCAVLPALCEEVFFRGFLLSSFRSELPDIPSALLCGLIFGLMHGGKTAMLTATAVGVLLCILVIKTGSLLPGMLFHLVNNGIGVLFVLPLFHGAVGVAVYLLGGLLCGGVIIVLLFKKMRE